MEYINGLTKKLFDSVGGDKKKFALLMKKRSKESNKIQNAERINNLKRMLAKGLITQEEYNEKIIHS